MAFPIVDIDKIKPRQPIEPSKKPTSPWLATPWEWAKKETPLTEAHTKALEYGAGALEKAFYPFTEFGIQRKALDQPWYLPTYKNLPASYYEPEEVKKRRIGGEEYQKYQELPWTEQLKYEAPAWLATAFIPGATTTRAALAPAAARGGIRGGAAVAARGALAPVAGFEWLTGKTLSFIFGKPIKWATAKTTEKYFRMKWAKSPQSKFFPTTSAEADDFYKMWKQYHTRPPKGMPADTYENIAMNNFRRQYSTNRVFQEGVNNKIARMKGEPPVKPTAPLELPTGVKPTPPTKPIIPETMITPPPAVTGVPMTVTKAMEGQLGKMGYSASAIAKMTPEEAWNILYKPAIPTAEVGVPEAVAPVTGAVIPEVTVPIEAKATNEQLVEAYNIAKGKLYINPKTNKPKPQYLRVAKSITGKTNIAKMTEVEAGEFIEALKRLPKPMYKQGKLVPPSIPKKARVTPEDYFNVKFREPTITKYLTPQTYTAQKLGVKFLVEDLEVGKQELDLVFQELSNATDKHEIIINKLGEVSVADKIKAKAKNEPTEAVARMRDLLNEYEEAPAFLTTEEKEVFNFFRNLSRTIIDGENRTYRLLGMDEIPYRKAYVRHYIAEKVAQEIVEGGYPLPEALKYWSSKIVGEKIFNPMEMERLTTDLEEYFSKDLIYLTKSMLWTGLKVIHLSQPLQAFNQRMGAFDKDLPQYKDLPPEELARLKQISVMPASTKSWTIDYVNQVMKGQQTHFDADIDRLVSQSGFAGLMNKALRPFGRTLGKRPVTDASKFIGRMTIISVLGLPRLKLARLMLRNAHQGMQDLALYSIKANLKGYLPPTENLKRMQAKSKYLRGYSGLEELPAGMMNKIERGLLKPYGTIAKFNYSRSQRKAYWACLELIEKPKHRGLGWADPQRTYTEPREFVYPSEEAKIAKEIEWGPGATQHQYIGMAMPEIFRHKTLIPFTRLQSWWMNHFFRFHAEAMHRALTGTTSYGAKIPWSWRLHYLQYLILGGAILTSLGYTSSYLTGVLPHNMSPAVQFTFGVYDYAISDSEWGKSKAKSQILSSWRAMVPGALAYKEAEDLWTGEKPLWTTFFYGREETGPPPHKPSWGIPALLPKDPYQRIEDEVWSQYPGSLRRLSDKILDLEKTDPREARRLLFENPQIGSQILEARRKIAIGKAELKRKEAIEEREKIIAGR